MEIRDECVLHYTMPVWTGTPKESDDEDEADLQEAGKCIAGSVARSSDGGRAYRVRDG